MNGDDFETLSEISFCLIRLPLCAGRCFSLAAGLGCGRRPYGQTQNTTAHTGSQPVFRLDGGNTTYAFGVNERGELQQIYWGQAWRA